MLESSAHCNYHCLRELQNGYVIHLGLGNMVNLEFKHQTLNRASKNGRPSL